MKKETSMELPALLLFAVLALAAGHVTHDVLNAVGFIDHLIEVVK